jgi:curved DNA-binding protein CbpA
MKAARAKRFDPYKVLGVPREADGDAIKSAFRRRAKDTHPDTGGDRKAFEAVDRANKVLSDPKRRAKFDETGEIDDDIAANPDQAAFGIINHVLAQAISGDQDPLQTDLMIVVKAYFDKVLGEIEKKRLMLTRSRDRAKTMRGRFRRKAKGENMLARMMDWQVEQIENALKASEQELANHERALAILADYDFERDPPERIVQYHYFNAFGASNSTSASTW